MDSSFKKNQAAAAELATTLQLRQQKIVFAESCTAGLAAAMLGGCPGISAWLCGAAVTYREATKTQWLGVPPDLLERYSAESHEATVAMALGALDATDEADVAVAVTGHLGPNAPEQSDGQIFVCVAFRGDAPSSVVRAKVQLSQSERVQRQFEAAEQVLVIAAEAIGAYSTTK